ncbi:MAG TPA: arginine deiminase-related protein [Pedobacter sp.]|nr:arginine deiminase-related protein [Pedobacter sp.]
MQTTNHILMIRPVDFKFNAQTAGNNKFQQESSDENVQSLALKEFDGFVAMLRNNGVEVTVIDDTLTPETPDSIFPNNWVSFHDNGEVILYPMFSENRRAERRKEIIDRIHENFVITRIIDLSANEANNVFLEGTGSLVLDRVNRIAYACLSLRTDEKVLAEFCSKAGYKSVVFSALDDQGFPIYHTNVMMCIGSRFAVVCFDSIPDETEKNTLRQSLVDTNKEIIEISFLQMNQFAGNMLEVKSNTGDNLLVMSEQAYLSLDSNQLASLSKYCKLVHAPLYTIEKNGGGSARCMLAEVHLPKV